MSTTNFRQLTDIERSLLESQGCHAADWSRVEVNGEFDTAEIRNCGFGGVVRISGRVRLTNVGIIAGCEICDGAEIVNTAAVECLGESRFGCGVRAAVINENGGRSVPLFPALTAQLAYIAAIYRHRPKTVQRLTDIFMKESVTGFMCRIGECVKIIGCGILRNVRIGAGAVLEGVARLENGTVFCHGEQRTYIGAGVTLRDFIVCGNSRVDNATTGERCLFGNGSHVSAASCTDSMFFAGSDCENGEFCSTLAGPYTASHHKSTLLIAGLFSFFNAGSGTNFSNHLLKSGPVHQGIHQRGCKYGSDAYTMLPALDGAFTTVIGHHRNHQDTSAFPYSLLIEREGQSWLIPAANLAACGPRRDLLKWQQRDRRDRFSQDIINFEECNPYIAERIEQALQIISGLGDAGAGDTVIYRGLRIRSALLRRGVRLYELALRKQLGGMLATDAVPDARGEGCWCDAAGMYVPCAVMEEILERIEAGSLTSVEEITGALHEAHTSYCSFARGWALAKMRRDLGHEPSEEEIRDAIEQGSAAAAKLDALADDDLRSETDIAMSVGYGLDGDDEVRAADFRSVRFFQ